MDFTQIKRAKVSKERLIHQIIIEAKVKGVLSGLGRRLVTDPVEALRNDFHWLVLAA